MKNIQFCYNTTKTDYCIIEYVKITARSNLKILRNTYEIAIIVETTAYIILWLNLEDNNFFSLNNPKIQAIIMFK